MGEISSGPVPWKFQTAEENPNTGQVGFHPAALIFLHEAEAEVC